MDFETNEFEKTSASFPELPKREKPSKVIIIALVVAILSFLGGYQTGKKGFIYEPKEFKVVNQAESPKEVDYQLLWDAIKVVQEKYIEKSPTPEQFLYGAVRGAVGAAGGPYTAFFEPRDLETFKTDLKGSFDGIGAEIGKRDGNIVIVSPLDESPAEKAGLLAKDIIVKVNGEVLADWTVEEAVSKIRGKRGTEVTLTIVREGRTQPFDVKIIRDKIEIKSVKWEYKQTTVQGKSKNLAVITVSRFGDDTKSLFDKAVNEILTRSVDGIILDLRNDPGGYLQTSVELASAWVKPGDIVVSEAHSDGTTKNYNAEGSNRLSGIKTIVLINGGSASASEIMAGALQDHGFAKLVGEKSFGKGSVQELVDLRGGAAVKVTVAKWITPGGKNLNKEGLHPDIEVKLTEADITAGKDPQMERAIEEVTK